MARSVMIFPSRKCFSLWIIHIFENVRNSHQNGDNRSQGEEHEKKKVTCPTVATPSHFESPNSFVPQPTDETTEIPSISQPRDKKPVKPPVVKTYFR